MTSGLHVLCQEIRKRNIRLNTQQKCQVIPVYSFINQLITSLKAYARSDQHQFWFKYFLSHNVNERTLSNFIKSWQKLKENSLECQLLIRLLITSNKNKIKMYLKARRLIINTTKTNRQMIDEVLLTLEDTIAIIFKLFDSESIRKAIVNGIKNIFLSFKIVEAKIYSTVLIEYLLSVFDSIFHIQNSQYTILQHFQTYKSTTKNPSKFDSIVNFQSEMHQQNGLYRKNVQNNSTHKKYHIIDRKFIPMKDNYGLKFNQQLSSMAKNEEQKQKSSFYNFISETKTKSKERSLSKSNTPQNKIKFINTIYKEEQSMKNSSPYNSSKILIQNSPIAKRLSFVSKNNSYSSQSKLINKSIKRGNNEIQDTFFKGKSKNLKQTKGVTQNINIEERDITAEKYQTMVTKNKQFKEKMLKTSHFRPFVMQEQIDPYDSIQVAHDSIVRNSRYWKQKLKPATYDQ